METNPLFPVHLEHARKKRRKLVIQIPCYNEERSLPVTLAALPRALPGIDDVEWLIVDDGSSDETCATARRCGVDHVIEQCKHAGLAAAFMAGVRASLRAGADIIVNTDADNQYCADDIELLIRPILAREADLVIGARQIDGIPHFSFVKKSLQHLGSWLVRRVSGTDVPDAPSGFRALTREAALRINVFSDYSYTLETIIQAGRSGMRVASVPIRTNPPLRPSRLMRSTFSYVVRSLLTVLRIWMIYRPREFFFCLGLLPLLAGSWMIATAVWAFGLMGELTAVNRRILEELQQRSRREELGGADE
jgi:glycosyltransferase involved in cell wall biosynthesis